MAEDTDEVAALRARLTALEAQQANPPPAAPPLTVPVAPKRKVGFILGVAIFFLPWLFAWFTLRKGYSPVARTVAFGWMIFGIVVAIGMSAGQSTPLLTSSTAASTAPSAPAPKVGTPLEVGDVEVNITAVTKNQRVGNDVFGADASQGGTLVLVEYTIKNTSDKPVAAYNLPLVKLVDASGTVYGPDAGKTSSYTLSAKTDQKAFSDLNPGITTRNGDVFEVSAQSFDPATWAVIIGDARNRVALQ